MFQTRVISRQLGEEGLRTEMDKIGCHEKGIEIMGPKTDHFVVRASGLDPRAANIVKQEFLAVGGDAAISWKALDMSEKRSEILMMGTAKQYHRVERKLKEQPFDLPVLAGEIESTIHNFGKVVPFLGGKGCKLMGILNVTPDSFYDGGKYDNISRAVDRGKMMEENGADIIDVGGESTRPGSRGLSAEEEKDRVLPVIEQLSDELDVPMSIDTYKPEVAEAGVDAGADIVNDVFGLRTEGMAETVADLDIPVIIMHMQGRPQDMQENPEYQDVISDIYSFFDERIHIALEAGIDREKIILDPGIGFGKTLEHNLEILKRLDEFRSLGLPLLLGASRKSFLGQILGKESEGRLFGSLAVAAHAVEKGVSILRVHDVEETSDVVETVERIGDI